MSGNNYNFTNAQFDYEPYPICYIPNFMDKGEYEELRKSYPDLGLFLYKEYLGNKYSLSPGNNSTEYFEFLKNNQKWNDFYKHIKSKEFISEVFAFAKANNVDMGVKKFICTDNMKITKRNWWQRLLNKKVIRCRFEFSIMHAKGGHILPHTDAVNKLITFVISFVGEDEWKAEWGGGTDVVLPKDKTKVYNFVNKSMGFEETKRVKTFPFNPNQAIIFIKTYNSWHSVTPMTGPETALRKTVTINLENVP